MKLGYGVIVPLIGTSSQSLSGRNRLISALALAYLTESHLAFHEALCNMDSSGQSNTVTRIAVCQDQLIVGLPYGLLGRSVTRVRRPWARGRLCN